MDENLTLVGFGIIRFGEVTALGTWKTEDGLLQISFETKALMHQALLDLERYRSSKLPITIHLPNNQQPVVGVVIGFERGEHETFYVSRAKGHSLQESSATSS